MRYLPFVIFNTIIYLLLTANPEPLNILAGVVIAVGISILLKPEIKQFSWRRFPSTALAFIRYLGILIYDVISGGLMVARLVLSRRIDINPGVIAIPSECDSELATALSAHSISLAPGEMVVEIDDQGVMYTHILDIRPGTRYRQQAQKLRSDLLSKIFQ
ncbi:MAG: Na+/H+ antiporter subunit E [Anaerolineales bacterium]|jgi:multicomponent Na+:H+ antiporter subunit E